MIERVLGGIALLAFGVFLIRTRRGAHAFYAQTWRAGGGTEDSLFAELLGPTVVAAIQGLVGLALILGGLALLFLPS